jgi:hypothetical protein
VGQDCILRAGFVTRASLRRLQIGAQIENLPHEALPFDRSRTKAMPGAILINAFAALAAAAIED